MSGTRAVHVPTVAGRGPRDATAGSRRWLPMARYVALYALACLFLLPVYVLVVTALKNPATISVTGMWELPRSLSFASFATVWPKLATGLRNSIVLAVPASIISSLLGCANGFVLSKWRFRGANVVFPLILFGIFVPYQAVLIPLVQTMSGAGLRGGSDPTGGLRGLLIVHIIYGIPITTLIFRNHFTSLPNSLIEAAQLDGAGMLRTFVDIAIPLARPAFAVAIIWQFTAVWNDFLFGAVMTSRDAWPVTIALNNIAGGQSVPFNQAMAGALLACAPTLLVYVLLGRYFMRGLLAGSLQN
ncbi:MAG: binding-protein-dependent transport system inner rane component [Dactylosporangium sp.]|jgi:glucose/mannose transport system permease protein|nr:binding-protein-dependent transport system inner rane component [Dactylosporangium sp.]